MVKESHESMEEAQRNFSSVMEIVEWDHSKERRRTDDRPWYQKDWPYLRGNQKVKAASIQGRHIKGKEHIVQRIALKWVRRLATIVAYDLKKKLFVFTEIEPSEAYTHGKLRVAARAACYRDQHGKRLRDETQDERVARGDYLLVDVQLFTSNWPAFTAGMLESTILHELLHVVRPDIGYYSKGGVRFEDERFMDKIVTNLIRRVRGRRVADTGTILERILEGR
jgi:hypothetical protein